MWARWEGIHEPQAKLCRSLNSLIDHSSPFSLVPLPPFIPLVLSLAHCPQILFIGIDFYLSLALISIYFVLLTYYCQTYNIFNIFITHRISLASHSIQHPKAKSGCQVTFSSSFSLLPTGAHYSLLGEMNAFYCSIRFLFCFIFLLFFLHRCFSDFTLKSPRDLVKMEILIQQGWAKGFDLHF